MAFGLDGRIPVCMRCGGREVRHQTSGDGLWAAGGEGVAWVCDTCHHIGAPFLMDQDARGAPRDPLWRNEYEEAAFDLENETWHPPAQRSGRGLGGTFIVVGALFLIPVAGALQQASIGGSAYGVVRALVGTGWLLAIGLAMVAVGLRTFRGTAPAPETEDAAVAVDEPGSADAAGSLERQTR